MAIKLLTYSCIALIVLGTAAILSSCARKQNTEYWNGIAIGVGKQTERGK